jgi:hypothetical protein
LIEPGDVGSTSAVIIGNILYDGGGSLSERGLVYSVAESNPSPVIGGAGVMRVIYPSSAAGAFSSQLLGLSEGTTYAIRVYAQNSEGITYSVPVQFTTLHGSPDFTGTYSQSFNMFDGNAPSGWTAISSGGVHGFGGEWGTGTSGGFRGGVSNPGVLGYQHNSSSGNLVISLTLRNLTGGQLDALNLAYVGRVERSDQGRSPAWTVQVNGQDVESLGYSTDAGIDHARSAVVAGLGIEAGQEFTISWTSARGSGGGASKQIGISDVSVSIP